jgi:hypothetical protein
MIDTKLIDILPTEISDTTAYHLVNFMVDLALAVENHYFDQLMRYSRESADERTCENCR